MVPIYFHYMSVSTYGAWLATGNVVAMLGLLESGFASVITQKLSTAIAQKDEEKFRKLAGANILTAIFLAVVIFVLGISISPFITDWINVTGDIASDIRVSYIICTSIFMHWTNGIVCRCLSTGMARYQERGYD